MMICLGTRQKIAPIKEKPLAHARAKESSRNIRRGQTSIKPSDNVWRPDQICQSEHHIPYLTLFSQPRQRVLRNRSCGTARRMHVPLWHIWKFFMFSASDLSLGTGVGAFIALGLRLSLQWILLPALFFSAIRAACLREDHRCLRRLLPPRRSTGRRGRQHRGCRQRSPSPYKPDRSLCPYQCGPYSQNASCKDDPHRAAASAFICASCTRAVRTPAAPAALDAAHSVCDEVGSAAPWLKRHQVWNGKCKPQRTCFTVWQWPSSVHHIKRKIGHARLVGGQQILDEHALHHIALGHVTVSLAASVWPTRTDEASSNVLSTL